MENAARSFCKRVLKYVVKRKMHRTEEYPFDYNGGIWTAMVKISLEYI